jgi:DNA polymerase-1
MVAVCTREGLPIRRTDAHATCEAGDACTEHVCLDADACNATDDPLLIAYADLSTTKKILANDIEALAKGTYWPVHTRYDLAETGRATSSKPNIMNWARGRRCAHCRGTGRDSAKKKCPTCLGDGKVEGARETFVPRAGRLFTGADYPQLELYALAQCCTSWVGFSKLAEALNHGLDPHLAMAAQILGISYEEAAKNKKRHDVDNARQTAKVANFGFPGGLGIEKLIVFAKKTYGVVLTYEAAKALKEQWFATWPEMPHYFARINALCANETGKAFVETLFTKRWRGNASYCAACNNGFQALGADCAKNAAWLITKAAYIDNDSALYNARVVAFVHDEFIAEVDDNERAHDAAHELARLMVEGANVYLPDVPIPLAKMEPLLMRRWSKKAEPQFNAEGRLVPWARQVIG